MSEITIRVCGPVGSGKSAIAGEIEIAMRALGIPVRFADPDAMQSEKNMGHADWTSDLEMYEPSVVIAEHITEARSFPDAADGSPITDTEAQLFGAGCDPETARFVARQLERKGLVLAPATANGGC